MTAKQLTLTSLALATATLMTACNSSSDFVQKKPTTTTVVKPTTPSTPSTPTTPTTPANPSTPTPSNPSTPTNPTTPSNPSVPSNPTTPSNPSVPSNPATPSNPTVPSNPTTPSNPSVPTVPSNPAPVAWDRTISYGSLKRSAEAEAIEYVRQENNGLTPRINNYTLSVNGQVQNGDIDLARYGKGHSKLNITETVTGTVAGQQGSLTRHSTAYLFQQDYSLVAGITNERLTESLGGQVGGKSIDETHFFINGSPTATLPNSGKFNYTGSGRVATSPTNISNGKFSYDVDFTTQTGSGQITGLSNSHDIILAEGNIKPMSHRNEVDGTVLSGMGIEGVATNRTYDGEYGLGFFGPNAEEVVGTVELGDSERGALGIFGGTKQ